jgi:RecA-family ATPase
MRLPSGIKNLRELILRVPLDLLVLDPITDFIDEHAFSRSGGFDENDAMHWKAIINPLQQLARQTGCAILFTRHKSKAMSGWKGAYKTSPARGSNYPETRVGLHYSGQGDP